LLIGVYTNVFQFITHSKRKVNKINLLFFKSLFFGSKIRPHEQCVLPSKNDPPLGHYGFQGLFIG
jgi:hypothetical protein